ncbi:hypothetical protein ROZALSC1DRAFT_25311 [Rozella allomycis CSF55]|uniref:Reverse transcriptase zinc-binding domain-containing protein n=1 Tax=Rozella allomycis (strain CSF55) TaxID=988480 RepID=A0A4P9YCU4_ROZAC|nr:hypothetical protein ROZALSC1DRAFT_25311 [Rozella allomycis CSF55]
MSAPNFMDSLTENSAHMICFVASLKDMSLHGSVLKERILAESKLFGYALGVARSGQDKIQLACSKTRYLNCPSNVRINCTQNGWVIGAHVFEHNHRTLTLKFFHYLQYRKKSRYLRTEMFGPIGNEYEKRLKLLSIIIKRIKDTRKRRESGPISTSPDFQIGSEIFPNDDSTAVTSQFHFSIWDFQDFRFARFTDVSSMCSKCQVKEETVFHRLFDCESFSKGSWSTFFPENHLGHCRKYDLDFYVVVKSYYVWQSIVAS